MRGHGKLSVAMWLERWGGNDREEVCVCVCVHAGTEG